MTLTNTCSEPIVCEYQITGAKGRWSTTLAPGAHEDNFACDQPAAAKWQVGCTNQDQLPPGYSQVETCELPLR